MSTILVVDDMAIFRDPISASLRLAGYSTLTASNGREALDLLDTKPVDLILLDLAMPVMDGLAFLRAKGAKPLTAAIPVILLTAVSDRKSVVEVAALGVRDYLLKSMFSMKDLTERVNKLLGTASTAESTASPVAAPTSAVAESRVPSRQSIKPSDDIPQLLTREQCIARAQQAVETRTLCGVVAQVIALCSSPRSELNSLANVLSQDTILAARVLQAANSAAYTSGQAVVSDLHEAVRKIGFTTIRNIALTVGVYDVMPAAAADGFNPIRCWQHSFATARICEELTMSNPEQSGLAYLVGLCHDLGEIMLHTHFGPEYAKLIEVQNMTGKSRGELEHRMLGIALDELVDVILRHVALPDAVRTPIQQFHKLNGTTAMPGRSLAGVLCLAEWYANSLLLASSGNTMVNLLSRADCRRITGSEEPAFPEPASLRNQVLALTTMQSRLSRKEELELLKPILKTGSQQLWVMCDEALCSNSPLITALSSLSKTTVHQRLPNVAEHTQFGALAVLTRGNLPHTTAQAVTRSLAELRSLGVPTRWFATATGGTNPQMVICPVSLATLGDFVTTSMASKSAA